MKLTIHLLLSADFQLHCPFHSVDYYDPKLIRDTDFFSITTWFLLFEICFMDQ